ncbi:MAG: hypothetical protein ACOYMB_04460 [Patescibacteria group bacterium]
MTKEEEKKEEEKTDKIWLIFNWAFGSVMVLMVAAMLTFAVVKGRTEPHVCKKETAESKLAKVLKENSKQGRDYSTINEFHELTGALYESLSFPQDKRDTAIKQIEARVTQVLSETTDLDELIEDGGNINSYLWDDPVTRKNKRFFIKCNEILNERVKYCLSKVYDFQTIFDYWRHAHPTEDDCFKSRGVENLINERGSQIVWGTKDFNDLYAFWLRARGGRLSIWANNFDLIGVIVKRTSSLLSEVNKTNIPASFLVAVENNNICDDLKDEFKIAIEKLK